MSLFFEPEHESEDLSEDGYGYKTLAVDPPSKLHVAQEYLKYLRSGGQAIPAWEQRLKHLVREGVLQREDLHLAA